MTKEPPYLVSESQDSLTLYHAINNPRIHDNFYVEIENSDHVSEGVLRKLSTKAVAAEMERDLRTVLKLVPKPFVPFRATTPDIVGYHAFVIGIDGPDVEVEDVDPWEWRAPYDRHSYVVSVRPRSGGSTSEIHVAVTTRTHSWNSPAEFGAFLLRLPTWHQRMTRMSFGLFTASIDYELNAGGEPSFSERIGSLLGRLMHI